MGACTSKTATKDEPQKVATKSEPPPAQQNGWSSQASSPAEPVSSGTNAQPSGVNVDFVNGSGANNTGLHNQQSRASSLPSLASQEGAMGPTGVYIPSTGFKTDELKQQMMQKYDMPEAEVAKALDFAESEEYVDVYCFTYCITGGPMDPTAFKVAGLQGMDKEAILQWATAAGNEDLKALNAEEQKRHEKARREFLVSQALKPEAEADDSHPEDLEELTEAYRIRFEEDTDGMSIDDVLAYFGVPEGSKVSIHKHLHPAKGSAQASLDEKARRKAAHSVALERFDELS